MIEKTIMEFTITYIEPNKYNPNVLKGEKYEALKRDMEAGNYDPILVSPRLIFYGGESLYEVGKRYVIVDGEWRWRAAIELGFKTIKCEVRDLTLSEAKTITYKVNRQRGNMDPFKEAELFQAEVEAGLTEEKVAARFGVDRSYVAGRRSLLKISSETVELYRDPAKLIARFERKIRADVEEQRAMPENIEVTDEEAEAHIQKEVAEIVSRGTLTPGHLKAIAALPTQEQNEMAEEVVHRGLTVRTTEDHVKRTHERLEKEKRYSAALAKARQKTCPYCGAEPKGFSYINEDRFQCSGCYNSWDFMVTKAELKKQEAEQKAATKTDRSTAIKKGIKNPGYIRRKETVEELTEKIREWVLRKVQELVQIEKIDVVGTRKDGQKVNIDFPGMSGKSLGFGVGGKKEGGYWWNWKKRLAFTMEAKDYKTVDAKTKIDLNIEANPQHRVELHRFLDEIVKTDQDPFLPDDKKVVRKLLLQYGEKAPNSKKEKN